MIKDDNFVCIHGWMVTRLGLSGASLIIYAVIYGFTQDGENTYQGSRQYLADWCGCSISGVKKCLKQLQEAGLIEQVYHSKDNLQVYYKANTEPRVKMTLGHKVTKARSQSVQGPVTKVTKARSQSDQAYKEDNIEDNIKDNIVDSIVVCDTPTDTHQFVKPTLEAVKTFAERKGPAVVDPERFYDFYEANGWKVGKNKMKDWRAAFRNWERTEKSGKPTGSKAPADIPYLQNTYTPEHLAQREAESRQLLDDLLDEGGQ